MPSAVRDDSGDLPHVRPLLDEPLAVVEEQILAELDLVRESLRRAVDAALAADPAIADEVTARGSEFDRRYDEVHDRLMALIARQAPVAGDLRLAMALLHTNDRVERMGAQCLNIATLCCALPAGGRPAQEQLDCLSAMARLADEQVAEAARVLADRDVEGARRLREHDAQINESNRRCFALGIADGDDEQRREAAFFVALMARAIERIADNAVDIGKQAAFVVTGRLRS
jgi:phosphate transport system protein